MVVGSQFAIANVLVDLNLAVARAVCQFTKFNSPPNFPAIRYDLSWELYTVLDCKSHDYCNIICFYFRPEFVGFCGVPRSRTKREPRSCRSMFPHIRTVSAKPRLSSMESL